MDRPARVLGAGAIRDAWRSCLRSVQPARRMLNGYPGRLGVVGLAAELRLRLTGARLSGRSRLGNLGVLALVCSLALLAGVRLAWSVAAILQPEEIIHTEAIVYDSAARILRGEPLYQPLGRAPHTVTPYTPLYYWLTAALQLILGAGFGPGRGLSFLSGLAVATLVGYLVGRRTGSYFAVVFGALLFLALGVAPVWLAVYREQLLGVALALGAVATLSGGTTPRRVLLAALLAALAILTKQTLIAAAIAGSVWLWQQDRALAARFGAVVLSVAGGTCLLLELTTGAFFPNTVVTNVNPFHGDALASNVRAFAYFQLGPVAAATLYLLWLRRHRRLRDDLLFLYWLAAALPILGLGKVAATFNYWIEFAAVTAVLATLAIWESSFGAFRTKRLLAWAPTALLGITVASVAPATAALAVPGFSALWPDPTRTEQFRSVVERVELERGEVLADPLDVIPLAGRPILLATHFYTILEEEGRWDPSPLVQQICGGGVGLLILGYPLESDGRTLHGYAHWPASVLAALRETMVLEQEQAGRFIYTARKELTGAGLAGREGICAR